MKLLNKPAEQLKGNYTNPELEREIEKEHFRLWQLAKEMGIRMGLKRSADGVDDLSTLTESIYSGYNELMSFANRRNQSVVEMAHGAMDVAHYKQDNKRLTSEAKKAESVWKVSLDRLGDLRATNGAYWRFAGGILLAILVAIYDVLYISSAFQVSGEPLYKSILMGIGISVALGVVGILGSASIEMVKNKLLKRVLYTGLFIFVSSGLYVICAIRSDYFHQVTGKTISPWEFLLLNLIALAAFHFIATMIIIPTWAKIKETKEIRRRQKDVAKNKAAYQKLNAEIVTNDSEVESIKKYKLSLLSFGKSIEALIQRYYESSLAEFKRAYIEESDSVVPPCFAQAPRSLTTFYDEYKLHIKLESDL